MSHAPQSDLAAAPLAIFDDGLGSLAPLADLRAVADIRTGALTLRERLARSLGRSVRASGASNEQPALHVNSRLAAIPDGLDRLGPGEVILEKGSRHVVAYLGTTADIHTAASRPRVRELPAPALLSRPWHVKTFRDRCLDHDLLLLGEAIESAPVPAHVSLIPGHDLDIHPSARIYPGVILDCESGPIVIDEHATVRSRATIIGPAYIGPRSTVLDHALIKAHTAIGPWCKVAGEVGGTIFQGFANKAHDGHLGDSWVGEWANLGAGTTNSNLLNTYGEIAARTLDAKGKPGPNERTGEQFLGAIIGDHVKTAICTRIMTGSILGTGTMWAATAAATGTIAPFTWQTDAGTRRYALEKFLEVMASAMSRRKVTPDTAYTARVRALWEHTG